MSEPQAPAIMALCNGCGFHVEQEDVVEPYEFRVAPHRYCLRCRRCTANPIMRECYRRGFNAGLDAVKESVIDAVDRSNLRKRQEIPMNLHVFTDEVESVIAASPEDARAVWCDYMGEPHCSLEFQQCADDRSFTVVCDADGEPGEPGEPGSHVVTLTAAEWCARLGRSYLSSVEC